MYQYNNMIVAGIFTQQEFANWLKNGKQDTGYKFIRKLDNMDFGNFIYLGIDVSEMNYGLSNKPRPDLPEYYMEVKDVEETLAKN